MIRSFLALRTQYPYRSLRGFLRLCQLSILMALPTYTFRKMSIVPLVRRAYVLRSQEEFRVRYYVSRIGFEEMWTQHPRETQADVEHFYLEHDKDLWRQAYLSDGDYNYKKKILRVFHLIRAEGAAKDSPILDYGGGAGVLVHYLARKGYTTVDIADIPSQTIRFVERQMKQLLRHVLVADDTFSLPPAHYAAIVCLDVLEHTYEPLTIVTSLLASLRPDGLLIISFPVETDFSTAHLERSQRQRDETFRLIEAQCVTVVPQNVYRKKSDEPPHSRHSV